MFPDRVEDYKNHLKHSKHHLQRESEELRELLQTKRKKLAEVEANSQRTIVSRIIEFLSPLYRNALTLSVLSVAIVYALFANYPEPPLSPILFQWRQMGKTFTYKNYQIYYLDQSNENITVNDLLLYLHGFPTSSYDIFKIFPQLRKKFRRIVAPDFLGSGFSDKPKYYNYNVNDQAQLVMKLMDTIEVYSNIHILAHDFGDTVAQELMRLNRETIEFQNLFRLYAQWWYLSQPLSTSSHSKASENSIFRDDLVETI
ncbi:hypothetical protein SSS_00227 [Sarcoptes scabiei]|nr:hypothetical protein SSS_00227 [Sarcoptes scabiei]